MAVMAVIYVLYATHEVYPYEVYFTYMVYNIPYIGICQQGLLILFILNPDMIIGYSINYQTSILIK